MQSVLLHGPLFGAAPRALAARYAALSTSMTSDAYSRDDVDALIALLTAEGTGAARPPAAAIGATLSALAQIVSLGAWPAGSAGAPASEIAAELMDRIIDAALGLGADEPRASTAGGSGVGSSVLPLSEGLQQRRLALLGACVRSAAAEGRVLSGRRVSAIASVCLALCSAPAPSHAYGQTGAAAAAAASHAVGQAAAELLLQLCRATFAEVGEGHTPVAATGSTTALSAASDAALRSASVPAPGASGAEPAKPAGGGGDASGAGSDDAPSALLRLFAAELERGVDEARLCVVLRAAHCALSSCGSSLERRPALCAVTSAVLAPALIRFAPRSRLSEPTAALLLGCVGAMRAAAPERLSPTVAALVRQVHAATFLAPTPAVAAAGGSGGGAEPSAAVVALTAWAAILLTAGGSLAAEWFCAYDCAQPELADQQPGSAEPRDGEAACLAAALGAPLSELAGALQARCALGGGGGASGRPEGELERRARFGCLHALAALVRDAAALAATGEGATDAAALAEGAARQAELLAAASARREASAAAAAALNAGDSRRALALLTSAGLLGAAATSAPPPAPPPPPPPSARGGGRARAPPAPPAPPGACRALAVWARTAPGLTDAAVGEVLAAPGALCEGALREYMLSFPELGSLRLERAVRLVLGQFRLPGEAQKISRVMEAIAHAHCAQAAPGGTLEVKSEGAAFVLAFAVVMLNTDAHNANVKEKMTLEQFVANNAGLNDGADFPREMLERIYDDVTRHEITLAHKEGARAGGGALDAAPALAAHAAARARARTAATGLCMVGVLAPVLTRALSHALGALAPDDAAGARELLPAVGAVCDAAARVGSAGEAVAMCARASGLPALAAGSAGGGGRPAYGGDAHSGSGMQLPTLDARHRLLGRAAFALAAQHAPSLGMDGWAAVLWASLGLAAAGGSPLSPESLLSAAGRACARLADGGGVKAAAAALAEEAEEEEKEERERASSASGDNGGLRVPAAAALALPLSRAELAAADAVGSGGAYGAHAAALASLRPSSAPGAAADAADGAGAARVNGGAGGAASSAIEQARLAAAGAFGGLSALMFGSAGGVGMPAAAAHLAAAHAPHGSALAQAGAGAQLAGAQPSVALCPERALLSACLLPLPAQPGQRPADAAAAAAAAAGGGGGAAAGAADQPAASWPPALPPLLHAMACLATRAQLSAMPEGAAAMLIRLLAALPTAQALLSASAAHSPDQAALLPSRSEALTLLRYSHALLHSLLPPPMHAAAAPRADCTERHAIIALVHARASLLALEPDAHAPVGAPPPPAPPPGPAPLADGAAAPAPPPLPPADGAPPAAPPQPRDEGPAQGWGAQPSAGLAEAAVLLEHARVRTLPAARQGESIALAVAAERLLRAAALQPRAAGVESVVRAAGALSAQLGLVGGDGSADGSAHLAALRLASATLDVVGAAGELRARAPEAECLAVSALAALAGSAAAAHQPDGALLNGCVRALVRAIGAPPSAEGAAAAEGAEAQRWATVQLPALRALASAACARDADGALEAVDALHGVLGGEQWGRLPARAWLEVVTLVLLPPASAALRACRAPSTLGFGRAAGAPSAAAEQRAARTAQVLFAPVLPRLPALVAEQAFAPAWLQLVSELQHAARGATCDGARDVLSHALSTALQRMAVAGFFAPTAPGMATRSAAHAVWDASQRLLDELQPRPSGLT